MRYLAYYSKLSKDQIPNGLTWLKEIIVIIEAESELKATELIKGEYPNCERDFWTIREITLKNGQLAEIINNNELVTEL